MANVGSIRIPGDKHFEYPSLARQLESTRCLVGTTLLSRAAPAEAMRGRILPCVVASTCHQPPGSFAKIRLLTESDMTGRSELAAGPHPSQEHVGHILRQEAVLGGA